MIIKRFADYAASVSTADLPEEAMHGAKRCVIDWFASTLRGGMEPPATLLADALADVIGDGSGAPGQIRGQIRRSCILPGKPPTRAPRR